MKLLNQYQDFEGYRYKVTDLIEASKTLIPFDLKVSDVFINYEAPNKNSLSDFVRHCKDTLDADLSYPIILSPCNYILDGKHRLAKAIINKNKTIKAVRFDEMPDCGDYIED